MVAHSVRFKKRPLRIFPIFFVVIISLLIAFLAISNWNINKKRALINSKLEGLAKKSEALEKINKELKDKITGVADRSYLEKVAREKFNLKKPGEEVVVIKKEKGQGTTSEVEVKKNFFDPKSWLEWLKSKF